MMEQNKAKGNLDTTESKDTIQPSPYTNWPEPDVKPSPLEKETIQPQEEYSPTPPREMTPYEGRSLRIQWFIGIITFIYAVFAAFQWIATRHTAEIAGQALTLAERPWVPVPHMKILPQGILTVGNEISIQTKLNNTGHTPAYVVEQNFSLRICPTLPNIPQYHPAGNSGFLILFPSQSHTGEATFSQEMTAETITLIQKGELRMYFFGYVRYRDVMGSEHKTGFAAVYVPPVENTPSTIGFWESIMQPSYQYAT